MHRIKGRGGAGPSSGAWTGDWSGFRDILRAESTRFPTSSDDPCERELPVGSETPGPSSGGHGIPGNPEVGLGVCLGWVKVDSSVGLPRGGGAGLKGPGVQEGALGWRSHCGRVSVEAARQPVRLGGAAQAGGDRKGPGPASVQRSRLGL